MKKLVLVMSMLAASTAAVFAADLAAKPVYTKAPVVAPAAVYNWTGLYAGIEGGWGWGSTNHTDLTPTPFDRGPWNINGGFLGGTVGYNWQMNQFVFGLEGDGSWADIHKDFHGVACNSGLCFTDIRSLGTIRARGGIAMNNWLFYLTGGAAVADVRAGIYGCSPTSCIGDTTRWGWTGGGGVEWGFAPQWSAKLEYLYADLGNKVNYLTGFNNTVSVTSNIIRGGINYHFNLGGPVVANY
jgi:outer membrane immunogenic protein